MNTKYDMTRGIRRKDPPTTVHALEELGRQPLSDHFLFREFLHSEISQIQRIPNIPENPKLALAVGQRLCQDVLEPIQARFGRISIRSAYRSLSVNDAGARNNNQYGCASSHANRARHIWDLPDDEGHGAMACIVVTDFVPYYQRTRDWQALAWWIHDHVPGYSEIEFFKGDLAAFNVSWHERPLKTIRGPSAGRPFLTRPGMENHGGEHGTAYTELLAVVGIR